MTTYPSSRTPTDGVLSRRSGALAPPRYKRFGGISQALAVQYAGLAIVTLFVLAPVVPTLYQSFLDRPLWEAGEALFTLDNYVKLFSEAGFARVAWNTFLFAGLTGLLSILIAVPMSIVLIRSRIPFPRLLAAAMQWPFFVSSLLLAFGWITMYGPAGFITTSFREQTGIAEPWNLYSIVGMSITEAVALSPITFTFCATALRQADASLENAARVSGAGPFRIIFSVILPMLRPPILYGTLLVISLSLETLSVPLVYGRPVGIEVFSVFLYTNGLKSVNPDYGVLGAASVIILAVTMSLVFIQAKLLKNTERFVSVRGKATRPAPLELGWLRWPMLTFVGIYLLFGAIIPIGGLVLRSFTVIFTPLRNPFNFLTIDNYETVFTFPSHKQSIINSIVYSLIGALLISAFATLAVMISRRSEFRFRRTVETISLLPQAMPGIIVGIGYFWAFAWMPLGNTLITGTMWAIIIAFGVRALPNAFGSVSPVVMQISTELDNAGRVIGLDWIRVFIRIVAKLVIPAFLGGFVLVFVIMMKEYTPAVFLATAETNVIGGTALELWIQGDTGAVAALAAIQIGIILLAVGLAGLITKRFDRA